MLVFPRVTDKTSNDTCASSYIEAAAGTGTLTTTSVAD